MEDSFSISQHDSYFIFRKLKKSSSDEFWGRFLIRLRRGFRPINSCRFHASSKIFLNFRLLYFNFIAWAWASDWKCFRARFRTFNFGEEHLNLPQAKAFNLKFDSKQVPLSSDFSVAEWRKLRNAPRCRPRRHSRKYNHSNTRAQRSILRQRLQKNENERKPFRSWQKDCPFFF